MPWKELQTNRKHKKLAMRINSPNSHGSYKTFKNKVGFLKNSCVRKHAPKIHSGGLRGKKNLVRAFK